MMEMIADIPLRYDTSGELAEYSKMYVGWGLAYGLIWWVLGGLTLMPLLLGMPAFAPLAMPEMRPVAMGSLMGHLIYGLILGAIYVWLGGAPSRGPRRSHCVERGRENTTRRSSGISAEKIRY